jgi:16S rRNA (uracil1498-N3)-methyltransferase
MTKRAVLLNEVFIEGQKVLIPERDAYHWVKVLRVQRGDVVELLNGQGLLAHGIVEEISSKKVWVKVGVVKNFKKPSLFVTLYQSVLMGSPFEETLEQAVEMGVHRFIPLITNRTQVSASKIDTDAKKLRYQGLAMEACKQSGNPFLPQITDPKRLEIALKEALPGTVRLFGSLNEDAKPILDALSDCDRNAFEIELWVGPEGGWTGEEEEQLRQAGGMAVSLMPYTLRAKTASLAFLSIVSAWQRSA